MKKNLIMIFLLFAYFASFAQEAGKFTLEIRAIEENAGPNRY